MLFKYAPYFYVSVEKGMEREVESVLRRKYVEEIADVVQKEMWDLDLLNHLAGHKRILIQLKFRNCQVSHASCPLICHGRLQPCIACLACFA